MTGIRKIVRTRLCPGCNEHRTIGERCGCGATVPGLDEPVVMVSCRRCRARVQAGVRCAGCGEVNS